MRSRVRPLSVILVLCAVVALDAGVGPHRTVAAPRTAVMRQDASPPGRYPACAVPDHAEDGLREFTLVAEPVRWEVQPGLVIDGWGYNGKIPGPTLCATEGELVRVHLVNHLPAPTTIHWHGIDVPAAMDGVPGLSQDAVEPGGDFRYEFIASNPGTRMYHSHVDAESQVELGLMGAFIIDPRTPEPEQFDREFTYILTEKSLDLTPQVALGQADILHRDAGNGRGGTLQADLFLMNGRAGTAVEPMSIPPGGKIRIRLINLGNLVHAMHLHGHSFRIIATDGNPVPPAAQLTKDTVLIGPAERYDLAVEGTNPGDWMFHCHINNHAANGMVTELVYDGYGPLAGGDHSSSHGPQAPLPEGNAALPAHDQHLPPLATATASATPPPAPATAAASNGNATQSVMLDNRFAPSRLTVPAGTTVTWVNQGNNQHTSSSLNGLWESGNLQHGDSYSFTFTAPGTYQYICRQHLLQGMSGIIEVTSP